MIASSRGECSLRRAIVCLAMCVYVYPAKAYTVHVYSPQAYNPAAIDARQPYAEAEDLSRVSDYQSRLIPIKAPRVDKQLVALPLEPEAEMLPAHYTGVKPPGVDHMELKYAESQVSEVNPAHQSSSSLSQSGSVQEAQRQKAASFEEARKGDHRKEQEKSESVESGGQKKSHSKEGDRSMHDEATGSGKAGNNYQKKKSDYLDSKAGGYRNQYHKDEFKSNHDFYDNDDEGGHLKKHGRYKEKHVAREGTYKSGASRNAGVDRAETGKKGAKKNSRAEQESKGRVAGRGYGGFFKNFQGFAKQISQGDGRKFGFVEAKGR